MGIFRKWYWRAIVAIAMGSIWFMAFIGPGVLSLDEFLMLVIAPISLACLTLHFLTIKFGERLIDPETRCRKCGYILKGITEPRCPECGEGI